MITDEKILFDNAFLKEIQDKFYYVHEDYLGRKRQFFENSGGSLPVSYTHLTLPTKGRTCRSRWSPYH